MHGTSMALLFITMCLGGLIQNTNSYGEDKVELRMGSVLIPRTVDGQFEISKNQTEETSSAPQAVWTNEDGCGITDAKFGRYFPRIVGGEDAQKGDWPWIAMLLRYYARYDKFSFVCGGSLIKKQWVLTAGHCFFGGPSSYTHVVLGAHKKDQSDSSVRRFAVARYHCHHLFIGSTNAYKDDVCLIKLAGEVSYTDFVKPICLPTVSQRISVGETCEIAGWGETQGTRDNSILQQAHISILNQVKCDGWYMKYGVTLPKDHFCAGFERGEVDSCQGDSGGPLKCSRTENKVTSNVLFGITSFGIGCAQEQLPGVYTSVAQYTTWIATKIATYSGPESCFNSSHLLLCGSKIRNGGTTIRTPVVDESTWLYPANADCSWDIEAPAGARILLTFKCFFHVEVNPENSSECFDYLKIHSDVGILFIYCGSVLLNPVNIPSNKATISFHSDPSVESSGFVIKINFLLPKTVIEPIYNSTLSKDNATIVDNTTVIVNETEYPVTNGSENRNQVTASKGCKVNCNHANRLSTSLALWVILIYSLLRNVR